MLKSYIKIALRVISRNGIFSVINILGLSIGVAAFVIIMLYVDYELSFENFQKDRNQIYRICPDKDFVGTPPALGRLLAMDFPEVETFTRIARSTWSGKVVVKADDYNYYESRFYFADSTFFKTFNMILERTFENIGNYLDLNPNTTLQDLYKVFGAVTKNNQGSVRGMRHQWLEKKKKDKRWITDKKKEKFLQLTLKEIVIEFIPWPILKISFPQINYVDSINFMIRQLSSNNRS